MAEVRPVADAGVLRDLGDILGAAFAFDPSEAGRWFERAGTDQLRIAHDERGEVVGGLVRIPMGQCFGGRVVPLVGLAGVAVRADRRRRGVASDLLRATLAELREHGVAASGLYASNHALYRGMGWEHAASRFVATLRPADIDVPPEAPDGVELARSDHEPEVAALYRDHALSRAGFLDRGPYVWGRTLRPFHGGAVQGALLRDLDGTLEAYLYTRAERLPDGFHRLEVVDCASRTPHGWNRIWNHLRDASTMVTELRLVTAPTDPLLLGLGHVRFQLRFQEPYLLRLVDVKAALRARGWVSGQSERVVMRVVDPILGDEVVTVDVADGHADVRTGGDPTAHVHVRGLSAMFSGHLSSHEAHAAGLVDAGTRSLAAMQQLFCGPTPWLRDFF